MLRKNQALTVTQNQIRQNDKNEEIKENLRFQE
jgi:hypothetical protein